MADTETIHTTHVSEAPELLPADSTLLGALADMQCIDAELHYERNTPPFEVQNDSKRWRTKKLAESVVSRFVHKYWSSQQYNHLPQVVTIDSLRLFGQSLGVIGPQRVANSGRHATYAQGLYTWAQERGECAYCDTPVHPMANMHADHIVSYHEGGKTEVENLACTCKECNIAKGNWDAEYYLSQLQIGGVGWRQQRLVRQQKYFAERQWQPWV